MPMVPDELTAEHNAVLERVRTGGQVSLRTKRFRRDGTLLDVRMDAGALCSESGALLGYVNLYHLAQDDETASDKVMRRAQLVRRLTDVVADINAELELPTVLERIAASLTELTGADAGGFVLIEGTGSAWWPVTSSPTSCAARPPTCAPAWWASSCGPAGP
nr:hypothetical protein GCM10020093_076990 [Planobispora longispora]